MTIPSCRNVIEVILDRNEKKPRERPSIDDRFREVKDSRVVQHASAPSGSPALVAGYAISMSNKRRRQPKLHESMSGR